MDLRSSHSFCQSSRSKRSWLHTLPRAVQRFTETPNRSIPLLLRNSGRKAASHFFWNCSGFSGRMPFAALFGLALLMIFSTNSAHAEFTVCNQTLDVVNLAVGQKVDNADQTDGW